METDGWTLDELHAFDVLVVKAAMAATTAAETDGTDGHIESV